MRTLDFDKIADVIAAVAEAPPARPRVLFGRRLAGEDVPWWEALVGLHGQELTAELAQDVMRECQETFRTNTTRQGVATACLRALWRGPRPSDARLTAVLTRGTGPRVPSLERLTRLVSSTRAAAPSGRVFI
jgi:hypothetical protein